MTTTTDPRPSPVHVVARSTTYKRRSARLLAALVVAFGVVAGLTTPASARPMPIDPGAGGSSTDQGSAGTAAMLGSGYAAAVAIVVIAAIAVAAFVLVRRTARQRRSTQPAVLGI